MSSERGLSQQRKCRSGHRSRNPSWTGREAECFVGVDCCLELARRTAVLSRCHYERGLVTHHRGLGSLHTVCRVGAALARHLSSLNDIGRVGRSSHLTSVEVVVLGSQREA